jgi:hypothetical protein
MDEELNPKEHIDKKLLTRMRIFVIILVIMTGALVYEVLVSGIHPLWIVLGIVSGLIIGFIAGRMFSIEWHTEKSKVVARLDRFGIIVLILYIAFSVARHWIFEQWFAGAKLSAFTVSFIEGAMLGRILSMGFHIKKVLAEQGKL